MNTRMRAFWFLVAVLLQLNESTLDAFSTCDKPLGLENYRIADNDLSATTAVYNEDYEFYGVHHARLNSNLSFRAKPSDDAVFFPFITVNLREEMIVTGIATQGFGDEWVTEYILMYAVSDGNLNVFRNQQGNEQLFKGNVDGDTVKLNQAYFPVVTTSVAMSPRRWHKNIALRMELYGCKPGYFFIAMLMVSQAPFKLFYTNRKHQETKNMEEVVLSQIDKILENVPGYLSTKLWRFSPFPSEDDRTSQLTAELEIHSVQSRDKNIIHHLKKSIGKNMEGNRIFSSIVQIPEHQTADQCHLPVVHVSISKDPNRPTTILPSSYLSYPIGASLQPGCNETKTYIFTWEMASVDRDSGEFTQLFLYGKQDEATVNINILTDKTFLRPGMQYVRCRVTMRDRLHVFAYDFGFLETMDSLTCHATPAEGTAVLTEFSLFCKGGYDSETPLRYVVTRPFNNALVTIFDQRSPTMDVTLPPGDPIHLTVEAKYPSLPPLVTTLSIKVTQISQSDVERVLTIFEELAKTGKQQETSYRTWTLLATVQQGELHTALRRKIKQLVIRNLVDMDFTTLPQLTQVAASVVLANENREEATQTMQEDSLKIIKRAVHSINRQPPQKEENISDVTHSLLKGAGKILASAAQVAAEDDGKNMATSGKDRQLAKENTLNAVRSVHRICQMRSKLLRAEKDIDEFNFQSDGVAVSLTKVNSTFIADRTFRTPGNEIHFPAEIFAGKEGLQSSSLQIIRFEKNPYAWQPSIVSRKAPMLDVTLWSDTGIPLQVSELSRPMKLTFLGRRQERNENATTESRSFLMENGLRYYTFWIPSYEATTTITISTKRNITLQAYISHDARPTALQYHLSFSLPNDQNSSCSNATASDDGNSCSSRDLYTFVLRPNATGHKGRHFIGIKIAATGLKQQDEIKSRTKKSCESYLKRSKRFCVEEKPAPSTSGSSVSGTIMEADSTSDLNYTLFITVVTCVFWDELRETWSTRGCKVVSESNETRVICLTNHLSKFSGYLYVAPNKIDFSKVTKEVSRLGETGNIFVLCTVCVIFGCYVIGLLVARRADSQDKMKIVNSSMTTEEEESNGYTYEVSFQTGMWYRNGTTARVGILMFGEEGTSNPILFLDPWREIKLFTRGSVNTFTIHLPRDLGHLYKIKVWHDNSGKSPSWFLYQVMVKDVSTDVKWYFVANRWLAVEKLDGAVELNLKAASNSELTRFKSLFGWRAVTNFADKHLCLSLFAKPPQNEFSRRQRLTCLLSVTMVALVTNAMFYQDDRGKDSNSFHVGPLQLSWKQILIGIESGLIALPVNIISVLIFRNIKRETPQADQDPRNPSKITEKRTHGFLPPRFVVIGWMLCLLASITAGFFTVLYSFQWGKEISNRWLLSVAVSLLQDIAVTGPIIIIFNTSVISLIHRKPTETQDMKGLQQPSRLIHGPGDWNETWQQPSDQKLKLMRGLKIKQNKLRHYLIEVFLYIFFVVLLGVVCYGSHKPSSYMLTKSVKDIFSGIYQVKDASSFWDWYENELVPGLYAVNWYNGQPVAVSGAGLISSKTAFIVGLPRIRQIRITSEAKCGVFQVQPFLRSKFKRCLSEFSQSNKDTTPYYKPGWHLPTTNTTNLNKVCPEPWRYKEPGNIGEYLLPYGGGGYIADLGYDANSALKVKRALEQNSWIDDKTVAIIAEFMVFEPAHLLLSDTTIVLQRLLTGSTRQRLDLVPVYIFPSSGSPRYMFHRVSLLAWMITILALLCREIEKIVEQRSSYVRKFFNWVSMLQVTASIFAAGLVLLEDNSLRDFMKKIRENPLGSWMSYKLKLWSKFEVTVLSVVVVLTTIKCLKLIQLSRHVHVMKWTLQSAYRYVCSFSLIILFLALAFAHSGNLLFGASDEAHSTMYNSFGTVLKMSTGIGKLQFQKMSGGSANVLAPVFLFVCMLAMTITSTNTFIAILDEAFHQATSRKNPREELGDYMLNRFVSWVCRPSKIVRKTKSYACFNKGHAFKRTAQKACEIPQNRLENAPRIKEHTQSIIIKRARLAETESLLSCESIVSQNQREEIVSGHSAQELTKEAGGKQNFDKASSPRPKDKTMNGNGNSRVSRTSSVAAEEEDLLLSIQETFREAKSELAQSLWANKPRNTQNRLSRSSSELTYAECHEDSLLSLIQCCSQHAPKEILVYKTNKGGTHCSMLHESSI